MTSKLWLASWSAAVLLSLIASLTDMRTGRIPNMLVLSGVVSGLFLAFWLGAGGWGYPQWDGVYAAAQGMLLGGGLLLPLYIMRLLGAGDVKLMAALGALLGWPGVAWLAMLSMISAALLAMLLAVRWGVVGQVVRNVRHSLWGGLVWLFAGGEANRAFTVKLSGRRSPHAVAVLMGVLVYGWGLSKDWGLW